MGYNPSKRQRVAAKEAAAKRAPSKNGVSKKPLSKKPRTVPPASELTEPPRSMRSPSPQPPDDNLDIVVGSPTPPPSDSWEFDIWEDKENCDPLAGPGPGLSREPLTVVTLPVSEDIDPPETSQQPSHVEEASDSPLFGLDP
jgi:hypothetical protein